MANSLSPNQRYQIYKRVIDLLRDDSLYVDEDQAKVKWYGNIIQDENVPISASPTGKIGDKSALEVIVDDLVYGITDFVVSAFSTSSYLISAFGSVELGQLSDVYLQNLKKNDGLKYDGSKWINYNISADYTNKFLNIDQNNQQTVLNGSPLFQYLDIDTTKESTRKEGRLNWNSFDGTLEVMLKGGNVTNQIGMETIHQVHNDTGFDIPNGITVRLLGGLDGDIISHIELANTFRSEYDKINSVYATTTQTIYNGQTGYVTFIGKIHDIDTSSWSLGDDLYVDPSNAGMLTNVMPTAPDLIIYVGYVLKLDTLGTIFVKHHAQLSSYPSGITKDPTGFKEPENIVVTYSEANRTITLTGSVEAYWQGNVVSVLSAGWVSEAHPSNPTQPYFLYYNGTNFVWSTTIWQFDYLMIAAVYFSPTGLFRFAIRETHGTMPWTVHRNIHDNIGAYVKTGGDISNYTLNSTTAANRRPYVSSTTFIDEDLQTINSVLNTNAYSTYNLSASNGEVVILDDRTDIVPLNGARPYYNQYTGGSWVQTAISNNFHMIVWLYTMPTTADTKSQKRRFVWIQGQQEGNLSEMKSVTSNSVNLGVLGNLNAESIFIGKIIIQYTASDWKIIEVTKLIGNRITQSGVLAGNFLSSVTTDGTTILGNGTAGSPLSFNMSLLSATSLSATGLTGNGTANYFPIYNGIGVTLTDSLMRQISGGIGIDGTPTQKFHVFSGNITTENNYGYVLRNGSNAYKYLAKYGTGSDILDISEVNITSRFLGNVKIDGGSFITVQNQQDGGSTRGIAMWRSDDKNRAIYMATAGANKSFNDGTAPSSLSGRTSHHIRFRVNNQNDQGFIWENNSETCLMSLDGDTGNLSTKNINVIQGSSIATIATTSDDLLAQNSGLVVYQYNVGNAIDRNYSAFMTFHRGGYWAEQFGLDTTNKFYHGGWSRNNGLPSPNTVYYKYYFFTEFNKPNASNITAGTFGAGDYNFPSKIGINNASPAFPLDIETASGNTNAKFGSIHPVYIISNSPNIGFNSYYNTGWKFGKDSVSKYAGLIGLNQTAGLIEILVSNAGGNGSGSVTWSSGIYVNKEGRFGVANSAPSYLLDVYSSSDSYQTVARLHNNLPSWATIINKGAELLFSGGVGDYRQMVSVGAQWSANSDDGKSDFVLKVRSADALVETMRVRHNGNTSLLTNIRIGSMSVPLYNCHVDGNIALRLVNGLYYNYADGTEAWRIYGAETGCSTLIFYNDIINKAILTLEGNTGGSVVFNETAVSEKEMIFKKYGMNDWATIQFESKSAVGVDDGALYFSLHDNNNESFIWGYGANYYAVAYKQMELNSTGLIVKNTITSSTSITAPIINSNSFYADGNYNAYIMGESVIIHPGTGFDGYGIIQTVALGIQCNIYANTTISNQFESYPSERLFLRGNMKIADGGLTLSNGNITLSNGNITLSNGNITLSNGNITVSTDLIVDGDTQLYALTAYSGDFKYMDVLYTVNCGGLYCNDINADSSITIDYEPVMRWRGASSTAPTNPITGDVWMDTSDSGSTWDGRIKIYDGSSWLAEY